MLGDSLRLIRVFHNLKQNELAVRLGMSQPHLCAIELCRKVPSQEIVARYAVEFQLPISSIWYFDEKLSEGTTLDEIENARGIIADKILDFLQMIERKRDAP